MMKAALILLLMTATSISLAATASTEASSQSRSLRVATYNIGMLNAVSPVPLLEEREKILSQTIADVLASNDIDVLAIQEAWTDFSNEALRSVHPDYVYFDSAPGSSSFMLEHKTGLGFLVKASLKASSSFIDYKSKESKVCGFGMACDRGVQVLSFTLNEKLFFVLNTHLTPFYDLTKFRRKQISELNLIKFGLFSQYPDAGVVVSGDYNISPDFGLLRDGDDGTAEDWQVNADLFPPLLEGFGLSSCVDTNQTLEGSLPIYTQDRDHSDLTALSGSTKSEPNQRIDHIIYCSKSATMSEPVVGAKQIFTEKHTLPSGEYELSDHYGLMTEISY